jgi:hypothetical protein
LPRSAGWRLRHASQMERDHFEIRTMSALRAKAEVTG